MSTNLHFLDSPKRTVHIHRSTKIVCKDSPKTKSQNIGGDFFLICSKIDTRPEQNKQRYQTIPIWIICDVREERNSDYASLGELIVRISKLASMS